MATQQQLEELTLIELFERMAGKGGDETSANQAFQVFHSRFKQRLGALCNEVALKNASLYLKHKLLNYFF